MENLSDYATAKRHFEARQRDKRFFNIALILFVVFVLLSAFGSNAMRDYSVPLGILSGVFVYALGIKHYFTRSTLSTPLIEQEMEWLYGEEWRETTGPAEHDFARSRIGKRRLGRWGFVAHLVLSVPAIFFLIVFSSAFAQFNEPGGAWMLPVAAIWCLILVFHARSALPTKGMLRRRERAAAEAMGLEIQALGSSDKAKRVTKPKFGTNLMLSDDGELVEIPAMLDEKTKREVES